MEEFVLIMRHEFRADSVDEVVEFKGLQVLQGEGNSIEVRKFAKGSKAIIYTSFDLN